MVDEQRLGKSSKRDVLRVVPLELCAEELVAPPEHTAADLQRDEDSEKLRRGLELLPERHRQIIRALSEGRSYSEIAADSGRSEAAVRKAHSRALAALRKIIAGL